MEDKLQRVQANFRKLLNDLHDCWYLSQQGSSFSRELVELLNKYYKISWIDECTFILDADYFKAHYDRSLIRTDHRHTHALHDLLVRLSVKNIFGQNLWEQFTFGMPGYIADITVDIYNLYMKEYFELLEDARIKWEESIKKNVSECCGENKTSEKTEA